MMKRTFLFILLSAAVLAVKAQVTVEAAIDSIEMLIKKVQRWSSLSTSLPNYSSQVLKC